MANVAICQGSLETHDLDNKLQFKLNKYVQLLYDNKIFRTNALKYSSPQN